MGGANLSLVAFNRGRISPLALARTDFKRTALSAEVQTNWIPRALGSMTLRPGWGYTGGSRGGLRSVSLPFIYSRTDTARLELTDGVMRVWVGDALITRPAVLSAIANGSFTVDLSGWSDEDAGGTASQWAAGGYLMLTGSGNAAAKRRQSVATGNPGVRHALNIVVDRGPVVLRVGSSAGGDQYISETTLQSGSHSLGFTPLGTYYVDLFHYGRAASFVSSVEVAAGGVMEITSPWADTDIGSVRWDQSGDVLFCACPGYRQRRIERRAHDSWSIVLYQSDNGPFRVQNTGPISISPSAGSGDIELTASQPLFRTGHIGALFRLEHTGQSEEVALTGDNQFSDPIRVAGVDAQRVFSVIVTGTWTGTVTLQYSVGDPGAWVDAPSGTWTANTAISYDDTLDNQVLWYRIGIKSGGYGSGTATAVLSYPSGTQTGIARVTGYISSTVVQAAVLESFASATGTTDWWESYWSDYRGYPSAVAFFEGRLWWAGKDRIWGSVSDDFANFNDTIEGDSGPVSRSIGSGPVDRINWLVPLQRLILGAEGEVRAARSSSFDEPLTPSNFNLKGIATDGAEPINAAKVGSSAIYVSGVRFYEASYDAANYDYGVTELSQVIPEIGEPGIVKIVVQHKPEKRVHCIRSDGTVGLMIYDKQEEVTCWVDVETDGFVEDAVILPGGIEDQVYYTVRRTVDGSTVRYHEKWALESQCRGYPEARLADSHFRYSGPATVSISGLDHLEGKEVVVWGWRSVDPFTDAEGNAIGRDMGGFTVEDGQIAGLGDAVTDAVVGLPYSAEYKSSKLAYAVDAGTALCMKKKVSQIGLIGRWLHARGITYGPDFETQDDLPAVEQAAPVNDNDMRVAYDEETFEFPGDWNTDSRVCLKAQAPRPATLLALVIGMETRVK